MPTTSPPESPVDEFDSWVDSTPEAVVVGVVVLVSSLNVCVVLAPLEEDEPESLPSSTVVSNETESTPHWASANARDSPENESSSADVSLTVMIPAELLTLETLTLSVSCVMFSDSDVSKQVASVSSSNVELPVSAPLTLEMEAAEAITRHREHC